MITAAETQGESAKTACKKLISSSWRHPNMRCDDEYARKYESQLLPKDHRD